MKALFDSINRLEHTMTFHRERQALLTGNVTNVDTPGYRPLDMEMLSESALEQRGILPMAATSIAHMQASALEPSMSDVNVFDDSNGLVGADGNAVNLERELAKIEANRVRYMTNAELVSRRMAMLRYAASDGNG
jgi:flagellar basal-body rod protein FlgB